MKPKIFSIVFVVGMCVYTYAWGQTHEKKESKREVQIESTKVSEKIAEALNPAFVFRNTLFYLDRNNDKLRAYMDVDELRTISLISELEERIAPSKNLYVCDGYAFTRKIMTAIRPSYITNIKPLAKEKRATYFPHSTDEELILEVSLATSEEAQMPTAYDIDGIEVSEATFNALNPLYIESLECSTSAKKLKKYQSTPNPQRVLIVKTKAPSAFFTNDAATYYVGGIQVPTSLFVVLDQNQAKKMYAGNALYAPFSYVEKKDGSVIVMEF